MEPGAQHGSRAERACFFGEDKKDSLRYVLGEMPVAHLPAGGGINRVNVAIDERGRCRLRTREVSGQQLGVGG